MDERFRFHPVSYLAVAVITSHLRCPFLRPLFVSDGQILISRLIGPLARFPIAPSQEMAPEQPTMISHDLREPGSHSCSDPHSNRDRSRRAASRSLAGS